MAAVTKTDGSSQDTVQVRGCCPLDCQDTCAWIATVRDGVAVKVSGAPEHPFTRGGLCAKVRDYPNRTYAEDRLLQPLVRMGKKGSSLFSPVSWDQALDTIAERYQAIVAEYGAQAIMPIHYLGSMGMVQRLALMRLHNALGASQIHGDMCGAPGFALMSEDHPIGFDWPQVTNSELIVLWGANLLSTCHHHWHFVKLARRNGARVISIDPRVTRTTRQSDQHITLMPGSDAVLASGIIRQQLRDQLIDIEAIRHQANDFDEFMHQVESCTPRRVADECGVTPSVLQQLSDDIGRARPATVRCGIGPQQSVHGDALVRTLSALALVGGHAAHTGGGLYIGSFPDLDESRPAADQLGDGTRRSLDMTQLGPLLTSESLDPPIKALMCWNMNPAVVLPDARTVTTGLCREDLFTVVVEHFMTDTARYADVVLPSTTQLEHFDLLGAWGHTYATVNHRAITPRGESRSHGAIMRGLAARLCPEVAELAHSDEDIALSALPAEIDIAQLLASGYVNIPLQQPSPQRGSLRLSSPLVEQQCSTRFQLLTPKAHHFLNSSFANMRRHVRSQGGPDLEMHPLDAAELGLNHSDRVQVRNYNGHFHAHVACVPDMQRRVVAISGKWWASEINAGGVLNNLTPARWSAVGQPAFNDTYVEVIPASTRVVSCLGGDRTELQQRPMPVPAEGELVLGLRMVGFCGTDLFKLNTGAATPGTVLGHELVGTVLEQNGDTGFNVGDRIAVPHHVACGQCIYCQRGADTMCETFKENLLEPGGFAEHILVRRRAVESAARRLPDTLSDEAAVFMEPAACVLRGIDRSTISADGLAVILGVGSMGLLHLLVLKAAMPGLAVVCVDPVAERQNTALSLGADAAVGSAQAAAEPCASLGFSEGADAVFDTVGGTTLLEQGLALTRFGGTVVLFAHAPDGDVAAFDLNSLFKNERRVLGTYSGGLEEQARVFELLVSGVLDPSPLITHRLSLTQFDEGVRLARDREALKVVFAADTGAGTS